MAISKKANDALQVRYDELRAQGFSKEDATAQIKGNLKDIGAYDKLKAQNSMGTTTANVAQNAANVASQVAFPTQTNTPIQPIDNPPPVSNQVYSDGQVTQSAEQIKQNAFDAANPVGTKLETITGPTTEQVAQATEQATFRTNGVQPTTTTTVETKKTPTGTVTSTTTPKETPVDFNVGKGREQDILNNLNEGFKNDVAINKAITTGDYETYKNAYGYDTADDTKKKMLDAFFQARQPKTEDAFFNVLKTGQQIYNKDITNKPEFKLAQQRYNDFKKFSSYSSSQLSSVLKNGQLLPGSKSYEDLVNDPYTSAKIKEAQLFNNASGNTTDIIKIGETQTSEILKNNPTTASVLSDGYISGDEYKQMLQTPEITAKQKEVEEYKTKYDTLKADYDNVELAVQAELKGTGATTSYMNALIADRRKGMYRDLQVATDTYNNALGTLSDMQKTQASIVEMNLDLWKTQEERAYNERIAKEQQNREFDLQYGDINSKDPRVQQVAAERMAQQIQDQYKGLPFRRTVPEMAKDIISELNSGKSLDQISTDIQNAIKGKEEYTTYAQEAGLTEKKMTEMEKIQLETAKEQLAQLKNKKTESWQKLTDGSLYNQETGEIKSVGEDVGGYYSGFKITQNAGDKSPNTKDTGYNGGTPGIDFAMPVGTNVVATVGGTVIKAEPNGDYGNQVQIKDANGNIHMYSHLSAGAFNKGQTVNAGDIIGKSGNTGFSTGPHLDYRVKSNGKWVDPNQFLNGGQTTNKKYKDLADGIINGRQTLDDYTPTERAKISPILNEKLNSLKTSDENRNIILESALYNKDISDTALTKIQDMKTVKYQLDNIQNKLSKMDTGPILGIIRTLNPYDTEAQVELAKLAGLTPKVARGIFGEVGVLTDNDIVNYQKALPNLKSTSDKNKLVTDFMKKLLAEGYKNAIITQAQGRRNMSGFIKEYDDVVKKSTPTSETYTYKSPRGFTFTGIRGDNIDDAVIEQEAQKIINTAISKNPSLKNNKAELQKIILQDPDFKAIKFKFN